MTVFFYDTEFLEEGPGGPISLISIGMAHPASGKEYYAVLEDMPFSKILRHPWLVENVVPYLPTRHGHPSGQPCRCRDKLHLDKRDPVVKPRAVVAAELEMFISTLGHDDRDFNELWAWYGSYDHVVFAQLWGRMIDLPDCVPMITHDLKVEHIRKGRPELPEQGTKEHHALADARWNVEVARVLGVV